MDGNSQTGLKKFLRRRSRKRCTSWKAATSYVFAATGSLQLSLLERECFLRLVTPRVGVNDDGDSIGLLILLTSGSCSADSTAARLNSRAYEPREGYVTKAEVEERVTCF